MTRQERVAFMEAQLDRAIPAVQALEKALEDYRAALPALESLAQYMDGGQWLRDYVADEQGLLPKDMKRGVLAQDTLFDLLCDEIRLRQDMKKLCKPEK